MKTNFQLWSIKYNKVLLPYYHRFCYLFPEGEEPPFNDFLIHCFRNTKQNYDTTTKTFKAPIY
jgi:hypothetical protein